MVVAVAVAAVVVLAQCTLYKFNYLLTYLVVLVVVAVEVVVNMKFTCMQSELTD